MKYNYTRARNLAITYLKNKYPDEYWYTYIKDKNTKTKHQRQDVARKKLIANHYSEYLQQYRLAKLLQEYDTLKLK